MDITGIGQPITKLLELIQAGCGKLYEPRFVRRMAAAQADSIKLIEGAKVTAAVDAARLVAAQDAAVIAAMPGVSPELLQRVQLRVTHQEVQRQENIERVIESAARELPDHVSDRPVDRDWITRFFSAAADVQQEDMQRLWGRILAGETALPGRYALRTLEVLRNLSSGDAEVFRRACRLHASDGVIFKIPNQRSVIGDDYAAIERFGLRIADRRHLIDAGLLSPVEDAFIVLHELDSEWEESPIKLKYNGKRFLITSLKEPDAPSPTGYLGVYRLTRAGHELAQLLDDDFHAEYVAMLQERLRGRGISLKVAEPKRDSR